MTFQKEFSEDSDFCFCCLILAVLIFAKNIPNLLKGFCNWEKFAILSINQSNDLVK
jgi:hypothetical protein